MTAANLTPQFFRCDLNFFFGNILFSLVFCNFKIKCPGWCLSKSPSHSTKQLSPLAPGHLLPSLPGHSSHVPCFLGLVLLQGNVRYSVLKAEPPFLLCLLFILFCTLADLLSAILHLSTDIPNKKILKGNIPLFPLGMALHLFKKPVK